MAPSPATQSAGTLGMPRSVVSPMVTQGRNVLAIRTMPATSGT